MIRPVNATSVQQFVTRYIVFHAAVAIAIAALVFALQDHDDLLAPEEQDNTHRILYIVALAFISAAWVNVAAMFFYGQSLLGVVGDNVPIAGRVLGGRRGMDRDYEPLE